MKQNKFSVIIPVYNAQDHISFCLESILQGKYKDFEIICVNDGSTDKSVEILSEYEKNGQIKVIHKNNGGVSSARNEGLKYATGEYVLFVDADDYVHDMYLEFFAFTAELYDSDIIVCSHKKVNSKEGAEVGEHYIKRIKGINGVPKSVIEYCVEHAYKRSVIGDVQFDEKLKFHEDRMFNLDVLQCANKELRISYSDIQLYFYYMNTDSAMHKNYKPGCIKNIVEAIRHRINCCSNENKSLYIIQGIKLLLSYRYLSGKKQKKTNKMWYQSNMKFFSSLLRISKNIDKQQKIKFFVLDKFPFIYSTAIKYVK